MSTIPKLTRKDIQNWTDETYFQRGDSYYRGGAIYDQRKSGITLTSKCEGTQAPFYRQEATFNEKGILSANCSCPVGAGGRCKHAVALLLTWVNAPESFQETEDLNAALEKKSKDELIAIIVRLIEAEPDLEDLIKLPIAGGDQSEPLDLKAIRRQASQAMRHASRGGWDNEWVDTDDVIRGLQPLLNLADNYLERGNPVHAASIYAIVREETLVDEDLLNMDESGDLGSVVSDCADGLERCLSQLNEKKEREEILKCLFETYRIDLLEFGGIGLSDNIPRILSQETTADEKEVVAGWIEKILPSGKEWSDNFGRQRLGELLIALKRDMLNDEEYLKLCRRTNRAHDLVERLLKLDRVDEALKESRAADDYNLLGLANIFVLHKRDAQARALIEERIPKSKDSRLFEWLQADAEKRKDFAAALDFAEKLFWQRPNLDAFEKLLNAAKKTPQFEGTRNRVLTKLEENKEFTLLAEYRLKKGEIQSAITFWEKAKSKHSYWFGDDLRLRLIQAAEKTLPREAIRLSLPMIEEAINRKNRSAYVEAGAHLKRVKALYKNLGEENVWNDYISALRDKNRNLRAFQEEMTKAKL